MRERLSVIRRRLPVWLAEAGMPFVLVAYLGLREGGYDELVRGEAGIAVWWLVLLGAAFGALPRARLRRSSWLPLAILLALAVWMAIGIAWSDSAERSVSELARVAMLAAVLALALALQGRRALRRAVGAVAAAIVLVAGLAVLSRLQPGWFPEPETTAFIPASKPRLQWPVGYWNALAALAALGVPLLLALASGARHVVWRALAVAAIPLLALAIFYTLSRGGVIAAGLGVAVLLALHPRRLVLVGYGLLAGAASAALVLFARERGALVDGLRGPLASEQGDEMLLVALATCAALGLAAALISRLLRDRRVPVLAVAPGALAAGTGVALLLALGVAIVAGAPGAVANAWDDFRDPSVPDAAAARFESAQGSGRYQFWRAAAEAGADEPLTGTGAGTYEFVWAREGTLPEFIRDAHSLYLEAFAELGLVGLLLVLALVASPFALALGRLRRLEPRRRLLLAGALGACASWALSAGIDWVWEVTVTPVAFLLLTAAVVARREPAAPPPPSGRARLALCGLALVGMLAIAMPLAEESAIRESKAAVEAGELEDALADARRAADFEPFAAGPRLQEALVLELQADLPGALAAARAAVRKEPANWRNWLVLARLEARAGNEPAADRALRRLRARWNVVGLRPVEP